MTFGDAALRWCAIAARVLGWRPDNFWQATPADLVNALRDPASGAGTGAPSREEITQMMERDAHGRQS